MINRGRKYWNSYMKALEEVNFYYGDRDNYLEFQKLIIYIQKKIKIDKWDLVVDFSCFERKEIKSVL